MKIQFEKTEIRVRISEEEFALLQQQSFISQEFAYLPLQLSLQLQAQAASGSITTNQVQLILATSEISLLINSESKKSGVKLLVNTAAGAAIAVDLQVDLHSKK